MQTGNFRNAGKLPNAVAICNGTRGYANVKKYAKLAPPWSAVKLVHEGKINEAAFDEIYKRQILDKLDARQVYDEICAFFGEDSILLCWEPTPVGCHRKLVAEWFKEQINVELTEYQPATPPKPAKAAKPEPRKGDSMSMFKPEELGRSHRDE